MKKNIQKLVTFIVIPFILLLLWLGLSLIFNKEISFSVLTVLHNKNDIISSPNGKLLKGQSIKGEFKARENHLGMIILQFRDFAKHDFNSEDVLIFKLKEKGKNDLNFVGTYRSGTLEHTLYFPFGFPVIDDSKNKVYDFSLTSLYGNQTNAVEFDKNFFSLTSGYQFPRMEIAGSKKRLISYLVHKSLSSVTNLHFILGSILYLIPLLFYLYSLFYLRKFKNRNNLIAIGVLILIFLDILLLKEVYLGIVVALIAGWAFVIRACKLESSVSYFMAIIMTVVWVILTYFNNTDFQNKLNVWVFTFFVIGLIQSIYEEIKPNKKYVNYKDFFKKISNLNEKF